MLHTSLSHPTARVALAVLACLFLAGCETNNSDMDAEPPAAPESAPSITPSAALAGATTLGGSLPGLTADEQARFAAGQEEFEEVEEVDEGLGPVFNESSCATCHAAPVGGTTGRSETRFGRIVNGGFDPLADLGGSLLQDHAIGRVQTDTSDVTYSPEVVPATANVRAGRITTPLFGLGLVDAVPDAALLALARLQAFTSPATRGTPNMVTELATGETRVGRFGWKAQVPTLHQFSGDAYLNEMGVTSPEFPNESCPQGDCAALAHNPLPTLNDDGEGVERFADFMTLLGPPPRGRNTAQTAAGSLVFITIGCANCHTPYLVTGRSPIAALSNKAFQPYSDFLLHDMGSLGDGIVQGTSTGRQMRTAPLWGLSSRPVYLHDGRAATIEAAILAHDGQGRGARTRYVGLRDYQRQALIAFLRSL